MTNINEKLRENTMTIKLPIFYDYIFPNYILPNAITTELGIVNYLHSLNSNKTRPHSFFDQSLHTGTDSDNLLTFLFGNSLGTFPNSTGGSGTHLQSEMYKDIVECVENSVCIGKQHNGNYIYPIRMSPHIDNFAGFSSIGSKLNGDYFWKHISAEVLEDVRIGRALIFLDYAQENFIERSSYINLHTGLEKSGIPPSQIVLAFNSFNAQELYESWFTPNERKLQVLNWPFVLNNTSYFYHQATFARVTLDDFIGSANLLREHHSLFKIRRPRLYRQALLYQMHYDGILKKTDWSWLTKTSYNENTVNSIRNRYNLNYDIDTVKELYKILPRSLKNEPNGTFDTISSWTDKQTESYKNAYFYICTESYVHEPYKSLTEKICKPMINFMPYVFMAFPGALALLRSLGFKTFSPFIDESYDNELDESKRFNMIYKEIYRLSEMSTEEIHAWYWQMKDILIHNHNLVLNFYKGDQHTINLVRYLDQRINN
jgi:hypothetical protein